MTEKIYCLDRIEGDEGRETAVFSAGNDDVRPRTLFIPLSLALALSDSPLREGGVCRIRFGDDGAVASITRDPVAGEKIRGSNSERLSALFSRDDREISKNK